MMEGELHKRLGRSLSLLGVSLHSTLEHEAEPKKEILWYPVVMLDQARIELGLSTNGWWVVPGPHTVTEFRPGTPCVFLLPVLEVPLQVFGQTVLEALKYNRMSEDFLRLFPFEGVIKAGLGSSSEHWAGLALKWAEKFTDSQEVKNALQSLATIGPSQRLRHAARKLLSQRRSDA